ncbi:LTA synthase family protein [Desulfospira joergensenii]|uniref:LTA synthase family protein n=1 Tax=Desulfospira joergensenii TaxID=53329 RepID=UPI0003B6436B|nr:LTA synthase family protein [Desulfospira joergensenii]
MIPAIFKTPKTRFTLIFMLSAITLIGFALMRGVLLIRARPFIDDLTSDWVYIFGQGLIYDISFISYFFIPFVLFFLILPNKWLSSKIIKYLVQAGSFLVLYGLGFCMVAEWCFWSEFGVRFNFISVDYLVYRREVTDNILQSYPVFFILPCLLILTGFVFYLIRPAILGSLTLEESFKKRTIIAGLLLTLPLISFFGINQSQRRFSDNNYVNELASNGPYQLFAAFRNNRLDYRQFYATENDYDLSKCLKKQVQEEGRMSGEDTYNIGRYIKAPGPAKKLNVMLISVESLSAKFLTRFGQQEDITPFMDRWFRQGLLFTNFYATGTRTTRGLEAITLSIPPTPGRSIVKRPDNNRMYSLGKVFKDLGYDTAFLYGGRGFFDNMNAFFSGNGYRIVDQSRLSSRETTFKNAWGVCDEDIYNRAIREANRAHRTQKPFFFHIMTTSNHQPFTFPGGKIDLAPGEGKGGSGRSGGVKYTDYALKQLIKQAKKQPWFEDTVFVVVADHCAGSAGKLGLPVEKYHIPLFIYSPKHILPKEAQALSSQIDLAPTLLALLNFSYESFFFGKDILSPDFKGRALIANYQKLGLLKKKELLFLSPGKEITRMVLGDPVLERVSGDYPGVRELMAYYQGADYVFTHRLNRWAESSGHLVQNKASSPNRYMKKKTGIENILKAAGYFILFSDRT